MAEPESVPASVGNPELYGHYVEKVAYPGQRNYDYWSFFQRTVKTIISNVDLAATYHAGDDFDALPIIDITWGIFELEAEANMLDGKRPEGWFHISETQWDVVKTLEDIEWTYAPVATRWIQDIMVDASSRAQPFDPKDYFSPEAYRHFFGGEGEE